MKRILTTTVLIAALAVAAHAQVSVYSSSGKPLNRSKDNVKSEKVIDPQRIVFGGWGMFGIGSGFTNIGITPILGYRITKNFYAGIGFGYQYLRVKQYQSVKIDTNGTEVYKPLNANIYSPSVWLRHILWNNIFAQVEYEHNIFSQTTYTNDYRTWDPKTGYPVIKENQHLTVPCLLVGAGIRQPLSERASFIIMGLYDVLQDKNSPYGNSIAIRLGVNFGF